MPNPADHVPTQLALPIRISFGCAVPRISNLGIAVAVLSSTPCFENLNEQFPGLSIGKVILNWFYLRFDCVRKAFNMYKGQTGPNIPCCQPAWPLLQVFPNRKVSLFFLCLFCFLCILSINCCLNGSLNCCLNCCLNCFLNFSTRFLIRFSNTYLVCKSSN